MKIRLTLVDAQSNLYNPEYVIGDELDPEQWATENVDYFNQTFHPKDNPRKLVRVNVIKDI